VEAAIEFLVAGVDGALDRVVAGVGARDADRPLAPFEAVAVRVVLALLVGRAEPVVRVRGVAVRAVRVGVRIGIRVGIGIGIRVGVRAGVVTGAPVVARRVVGTPRNARDQHRQNDQQQANMSHREDLLARGVRTSETAPGAPKRRRYLGTKGWVAQGREVR
jgi:hypothetical protein